MNAKIKVSVPKLMPNELLNYLPLIICLCKVYLTQWYQTGY